MVLESVIGFSDKFSLTVAQKIMKKTLFSHSDKVSTINQRNKILL